MRGEAALKSEQRAPDFGDRGDNRGCLRDRIAAQPWVREEFRLDPPCRRRRRRNVGWIARLAKNEKSRRPIERARIEMCKSEVIRKTARQGPFARTRRPVYREDKMPMAHYS
jgi:hypothetical protein